MADVGLSDKARGKRPATLSNDPHPKRAAVDATGMQTNCSPVSSAPRPDDEYTSGDGNSHGNSDRESDDGRNHDRAGATVAHGPQANTRKRKRKQKHNPPPRKIIPVSDVVRKKLKYCLDNGVPYKDMPKDVQLEYAVLALFHNLKKEKQRDTQSRLHRLAHMGNYFVTQQFHGQIMKLFGYKAHRSKNAAAALRQGEEANAAGRDMSEYGNEVNAEDIGADGAFVTFNQRGIPIQITGHAKLCDKANLKNFLAIARRAEQQRDKLFLARLTKARQAAAARGDPDATQRELEARKAAEKRHLDDEKDEQRNGEKYITPISKLNGIIFIDAHVEVEELDYDNLTEAGIWIIRLVDDNRRKLPSKLTKYVHDTLEKPSRAVLEKNPLAPPTSEDFKLKPEQLKMADSIFSRLRSRPRDGPPRVYILESPMGTGKSAAIAQIMVDFFWWFYFRYHPGCLNRERRMIPGTLDGLAPKAFSWNKTTEDANPESRDPVFILTFPRIGLCNAFKKQTLYKFGFAKMIFGEKFHAHVQTCNSSQGTPVNFEQLKQWFNEGKRIFLFVNVKGEEVRKFQRWVPHAVVKDECHEHTRDNSNLEMLYAATESATERDICNSFATPEQKKWYDWWRKWERKKHRDSHRKAAAAQPFGEFISRSLHAVNDAGNGPLGIFGLAVSATVTAPCFNLPGAEVVYRRSESHAVLHGDMCDYRLILMSMRNIVTDEFLKLRGMSGKGTRAVSALQVMDGMQEYETYAIYVPCGKEIKDINEMETFLHEAFDSRVKNPGFGDGEVEIRIYKVHTNNGKQESEGMNSTIAAQNIETFKQAKRFYLNEKGRQVKLWHFILDCGSIKSGTDLPNCDGVAYASFPDDLNGDDVLEHLIQENRATRTLPGKFMAHLFIPKQVDHPVVQALVQRSHENDAACGAGTYTGPDIGSRLVVRTIARNPKTDEKETETPVDDDAEDLTDTVQVRATYDRTTFTITRENAKKDHDEAQIRLREAEAAAEQRAKDKAAQEDELAGIPLKVSNSAHPDRQLCLCFRLMLVGGKRPPKKGETGPVEDDAECLNWINYRDKRRGKPAPAKVETLPPDWRFVLADEYFQRLGITAAEAWILVAFLTKAPGSTRPPRDRVNRLAEKWKAKCMLCTNPKRAAGGEKLCCHWGACPNFGGTAHKNGYCSKHFTSVTAIAKAALAEAQPGVAYDAAAHFALGHARVQADPDTKKVPGKVYVAVKDRPTSAGAGSSTDPLPPAPPTT